MTTIGIVGLGLIGGSVRLAADRAGHRVLAWDADPVTREEAGLRGLVISEDLSDAELIFLAAPMTALTEGLVATLAQVRISDTATVTDVGSLKQPVLAAASAAGVADRFIGGHPLAGSERTGFTAARADLFDAATWVLCLDSVSGADSAGSDIGARSQHEVERWLQVAAVVTDLGAGVLPLMAAEHDVAMAVLSGVPHLLALALSTSAELAGPVVRALAAGSFADLTRVAGSSPTLLYAVTEQNAPAVRGALRLVLEQLDRPWSELIEHGREARQHFDDWPHAGETPSALVQVTVSGPQDLLELGRAGVAIESVDPGTAMIGYRSPPSP